MSRTILVAIDGSDASYNAFDFACELGRTGPWRLMLLHVLVESAEGPSGHRSTERYAGGSTKSGEACETVTDSLDAELTRLADLARRRGIEMVDTAVAIGEPSDQIVEIAGRRRCAAIVVGVSGLGTGDRVGGCTERVLQSAHIPVVVVP